MLLKLFLVFTACVVNWTTVQSCSCAGFPHLQDIFCTADFLIRVKVTGVTHEGELGPGDVPIGAGKNVYSINIIQEYKTSPAYMAAMKKIYTADSSATCGVNLQVGEQYVLSGSVVSGGKLKISSCRSFVDLWKKMSKFLKKALKKKLFKKNCMSAKPCKVCSFQCVYPPPSNVCNIPEEGKSSCYYTETYCQGKKGKCQFKMSKKVRKCLKT